MGIGIASFGLQVATTVIYAYTCEVGLSNTLRVSMPLAFLTFQQCYKPQAAEIGAVLNFGRNMFSFPIGFYAIPLSTHIGIQSAWILLAMLDVACFLPLIVLMWKGEEWRRALGLPKFHRDL